MSGGEGPSPEEQQLVAQQQQALSAAKRKKTIQDARVQAEKLRVVKQLSDPSGGLFETGGPVAPPPTPISPKPKPFPFGTKNKLG